MSEILPNRIPPKTIDIVPKPEVSITVLTDIVIYTDGSAIDNLGSRGYGVVMQPDDKTIELSQGYLHTTNNRMEMMAVITALEELRESESQITIVKDSKYVIE